MPSLSNDVQIRVATSADNSGLESAEHELGNLRGAAEKSGSSIGGFFKDNMVGASIAAAGLVTTLGLAASSALNQAGAYQQSRVSFETMLGSADKAKTLLKQMSDFAATTPFELPQVVEGGKNLLAFGVNMKDVIPTFTTLGNIAAGVGTDKLPGLINVFGQVKAASRMMTQDMLQFTSAGVPMMDLLAQHFNTTTDKVKGLVEGGKVGFKDLQQSLELLGGPSGKWGDLMAKQSQTFQGTLSNVSDQMGRVLRQAVGIGPDGDVRKGSLFDVTIKGANMLLSAMTAASPYVEKMTNYIEKNHWVVAALGGALAGLAILVGVTLVSMFAGAIATMGVFIAIGAAVGAVAFLVVTHWSQISDFFVNLWRNVVGATQNAWNNIIGGVNYVKDHFFEIVGFMIGFWATLPIKMFILMVEGVGKVIGFIGSVNWGGVFGGLFNAWVGGWKMMLDAAVNVFNFVTRLNWGSILSGIGKGVGNAIIGLIEGAINGAFSGIPGSPKVRLPRFERGVRNFSGGLAVVGDVNGGGGEIVDLPAGSNVYTNKQSKDMMSGRTININGNIMLGSAAAVDRFFTQLDQDSINIGKGLTAARGIA